MKIRHCNNDARVSFSDISVGEVFRDDSGTIFMKTDDNGMAIVLSDSADYLVASEIGFDSFDEIELLDCELVIK